MSQTRSTSKGKGRKSSDQQQPTSQSKTLSALKDDFDRMVTKMQAPASIAAAKSLMRIPAAELRKSVRGAGDKAKPR